MAHSTNISGHNANWNILQKPREKMKD